MSAYIPPYGNINNNNNNNNDNNNNNIKDNNNNINVLIHIDDPIYVHPSDNAISSIINFKLTGPENYRLWRSSMVRALKLKTNLALQTGLLLNLIMILLRN